MAIEKIVLPSVPEVLLKRRKRRIQCTRKRSYGEKRLSALARAREAQYFKRAEKYAIYYRLKAKQEVRLSRLAKKEGRVRVPAEPKIAFVIRTKGINCMPPKAKKILQLMRLRQLNNGIFVRINKPALNMLRLAEPYVTWGYPNLKSVRDLLYKRGFGRMKGRRIPLSGNQMIERRLGKFGIVCMEDLVHEIHTMGKYFTKVNNFLSTFKLNNPSGGWKRKSTHYVVGGDCGNRERKINNLLRKMV